MRDLSPLPWKVKDRTQYGIRMTSGRSDAHLAYIKSIDDARLIEALPEVIEVLESLLEHHSPNSSMGLAIRRALYTATLDECLLAELSGRHKQEIMAAHSARMRESLGIK